MFNKNKTRPAPPVLTLSGALDSREPQRPDTPRSVFIKAISNIEPGETWSESFKRQEPNRPSEIIPGLYLGNAKTSAAYLTGQLDGDDNFPCISRIVTILSDDYRRCGIETFPEPCSSGENIQRLVIPKYDSMDNNLVEDFDNTGAFIREGIETFQAAAKAESGTDKSEDPSALKIQTPVSETSRTPESSPTDKQTGGILVHCHAGVSRSSTIVITYLLKYHQNLFALPVLLRFPEQTAPPPPTDPKVTDRAIEYVQNIRPIVSPNMNFRVQLSCYVHRLKCSITDPKTGANKYKYMKFVEDFEEPGYARRLPPKIKQITVRRIPRTEK